MAFIHRYIGSSHFKFWVVWVKMNIPTALCIALHYVRLPAKPALGSSNIKCELKKQMTVKHPPNASPFMSPRSTTAFYPLEGKKLDCWRSSSWDLTNIACDWWVRGWIPLWAPLARSIKPGHLTLRRALGGGGGSMCSQREQSCSWAQWVQGCRVSRLVEGVLWCQVVCVGSTGGPSLRVASMWVGVLERWRCQGTRAWGGTPKSRHAWADGSHGIWGLTFFGGLTAGFWILTYWYRLISEMQEFSISNWCTLIIWCPAVGWSQNHQKALIIR